MEKIGKEGTNYGIRLGTLLVFAMILPGFVAFGMYSFFFNPSLFNESLIKIITYIFGVGFIANAFGHFF